MKKNYKIIILVASILIIAGFTLPFMSTTPLGSSGSMTENFGGFKSDSTLQLPKGYATTFTGFDSAGRMYYNTFDSNIWYNNGLIRKRVADSPGNGFMAIGQLVSGGGATDAILFRQASETLNAQATFKYIGYNAPSDYFLQLTTGGDSLIYSGNVANTILFGENQLVLGKRNIKDTFDLSLLTGKRKVQFQDASGTVAYLSNITSMNVAQVDSTTLTGAVVLRTFTTPSAGTYVVGFYAEISSITTDNIDFRIKFTDPAGAPQYFDMFNSSSVGYFSRGGFLVRAGSGTIITVYDSLLTGGGSISYYAGCIIQFNHT